MKYIKNLPEVDLVSLHGQKFTDEQGNQLKMNSKLFLINLLADEKFASDKQGSAKLLFIVEIKKQIDRQDFNKDYIIFENEQYKAIKESTETGTYDSRMAVSLAPFIQAVLSASDEIPE